MNHCKQALRLRDICVEMRTAYDQACADLRRESVDGLERMARRIAKPVAHQRLLRCRAACGDRLEAHDCCPSTVDAENSVKWA
jgi:hypothetical protein